MTLSFLLSAMLGSKFSDQRAATSLTTDFLSRSPLLGNPQSERLPNIDLERSLNFSSNLGDKFLDKNISSA